jgi:hypothetical protein
MIGRFVANLYAGSERSSLSWGERVGVRACVLRHSSAERRRLLPRFAALCRDAATIKWKLFVVPTLMNVKKQFPLPYKRGEDPGKGLRLIYAALATGGVVLDSAPFTRRPR